MPQWGHVRLVSRESSHSLFPQCLHLWLRPRKRTCRELLICLYARVGRGCSFQRRKHIWCVPRPRVSAPVSYARARGHNKHASVRSGRYAMRSLTAPISNRPRHRAYASFEEVVYETVRYGVDLSRTPTADRTVCRSAALRSDEMAAKLALRMARRVSVTQPQS